MPVYEYRCSGCGARVEVLVRNSREAPTCPHCGALLTQKLLSAPYISSGRTSRESGQTCCGRNERCATPPCSAGGTCWRES
ncbi:MAG TPA: zinc ribbon domain-containing protein [Chloroflexi bacterium]|nr:zinc ribbon domain-containing protein [Chloroflexota bacterium]